MGFELEVDNYRALRRVRWKADGVCALVGPNGSGKTTLLSVLHFLRTAAPQGFGVALSNRRSVIMAVLCSSATGMPLPTSPFALRSL